VVTRESEWNKYAQTSAIALLAPLPSETRHVTWADHGGRVAEVVSFRCVFCGAADIVKRDFAEKNKDYKTVKGTAAPGDGRMFAARPPAEEV
jgi:hypothetical protein